MICMKLLEVCPGPRNYRLNFGDDPDCGADIGSGLRSRSDSHDHTCRNLEMIRIQDSDYGH